MRRLLAFALLVHASCLRQTQFHCDTDTACGAGGRCETDVGFCSVADGTCASGHRFGDAAGNLSNTCVGGGNLDGGIDAPGSGTDGSGSGSCPSGYLPVTGGNANHKYKALTAHSWMFASGICTGDAPTAYLAVPDDAGELAGIAGLVTGNYWVGIDDINQEGVYVDVKTQQPHTFLPWAPGEPNNQGNQDCVAGVSDTEIATEQCGQLLLAVCECED